MSKLRYRGPDTEEFKSGEVYDAKAASEAKGLDPEVWQVVVAKPDPEPKAASAIKPKPAKH